MTSGLTHATDTVEQAAATPDQPQPFRELGLKDDEYQRIREILGRRPTDAELAMYSVMWSEHCSYKSSKVHLRYFGETTTDEMRAGMLAGIGENAGVVDIGDGWAVTFKVESHNHPSYVEPYQGAATGVGGIVRDIMAMGARPVAVMDQLRFGAADAPDTRRVLDGVVRGVGGYGNSLGLPNVGGETVFDASYAGNPLVNALCVGVLRRRICIWRSLRAPATRSFCSARGPGWTASAGCRYWHRRRSAGTSGIGPQEAALGSGRRPVHREGADRVLPGAVRRRAGGRHPGPRRRRIVLRDVGARSAGDGGMHIELDAVPLRAKDMMPAEILSSESQERMCAVVTPQNVAAFIAVCAKWEILATVIGEVTDGDRLVITWQGETVVDVPPRTVAHEGPVYQRPSPARAAGRTHAGTASLARPSNPEQLRATLLALAASPHLCSRALVTDQYDRYVRGNTSRRAGRRRGGPDRRGQRARCRVVAPTQLAVLRAGPLHRGAAGAGRGVPQRGGQWRHAGRGHRLPELRFAGGPGVMWQFEQAVHGLADGCAVLGVPVTGGNVSFYNQTGSMAILPTPVVGVLGVLDDVTRRIPTGLRNPGEKLLLLGATREELDGSEWAQGARPPWRPAAQGGSGAERALAELLAGCAADALVTGAHDLSEGGLAQALVEACVIGRRGARVELPAGDPFVTLFSESTARVLVAVPRTEESRFASMCEARDSRPPGSASSTKARTRSRYKVCSPCHWPSCAARPKGCWPPFCDE